ncbi:transglutaminase-like domain-containing protein [Priestia megaterium]|uniref:transglutaminase-like domain-containing protein n=1 Tax=Priestia megaterium TaxID=1404 RepID=UPI0024530317|nr:transglutaminase-like domain-containing protein [Priestia megaterium]MDH3141370.1 transglutaminase-like domain-containing protein [Priestia megaterium]MED4254739.1 transglutaminase-like domain-containing protein [Priestia megaterium]MED4266562.1 transglutaminase-like domain-containing protein [Priestia megaterium]MED4275884.1 transglutaminase-like domain-containing protein [Priestia megaterium]MED4314804.1 transglutaminase-like domain-containing protein [Priestia megaterium]
MKLICESLEKEDYTQELPEVNFTHPLIQQKVRELKRGLPHSSLAYIKKAYEFVRDEVSHSWDIQSRIITKTASEALKEKEGICYSKCNLLAALLRAEGIPAGFCYQRLILGDTIDTGYCIHALNAVYIKSEDRWIRLDARGNKEGVQADFSLKKEKLAFSANSIRGEIDYPVIYTKPHKKTMDLLSQYEDCLDMYLHYLPTEL